MLRRTAVSLLVTSFGWAALCAPATARDLDYQGWGARVGATSSPGMPVLGAHFDLGEVADRIHLVPALELGLRSDTTVLTLVLPLLYVWGDTDALSDNARFYVGGGAVLNALDAEGSRARGEDFEVAPVIVFGLEVRGGLESPFLEGSFSTGDAYSRKLVIGWRFRRY